MDSDTKNDAPAAETAWFCVRSQPKREHIAAAHLKRIEGVEVFCPRLRIRKATRRGVVAFVESLFPNYIFARFDFHEAFDKVKYSPSVSTIVNFGGRVPQVPEGVIVELKETYGVEDIYDFDEHVQPGDNVIVGEGPFQGMRASVLRVLTPFQRVEILLEMLGRATPVIVNPASLVVENLPPG
jgi:transcriptional antiterminator RfaH